MTVPPHRAQLLVCHEHIAGPQTDRRTEGGKNPGFVTSSKRFCDLAAYAWCFTCDYYVCDIHLNSRHNGEHDIHIEFPNSTWQPGPKVRMEG